jgi:DHA1 family multidrug resistance protein-like MFS transporter
VSPSQRHKPAEQISIRILFWLSASVGVTMVGMGIIWPIMPIYAMQLGAGGTELGFIIAAFNLARSVFNPVVGRLSDRLGRKPFMLAGLFCYALLSVAYIQSTSVAGLIAVRFAHGLAAVCVAPVAMAVVAEIAPPHRLGAYMGTLSMALMLGVGAGPLLGGIIKDWLGMEAAFMTMGGLALVTSAGILTFVPSLTRKAGETVRPSSSMFQTLRRNRVLQMVFIIRFFSAAGQGAVYTFLPLYGLAIGISSAQVGILLGINVLLIAFLQRPGGKLADRTRPVVLMVAGIAMSGLAVAGMPLVQNFSGALVMNILMGVANGIAVPAALVLAGREGARVGMGAVMGLFDAALSLGFIVSPILLGMVHDAFGIEAIFHVGGAIILGGTLLVVMRFLPPRARL